MRVIKESSLRQLPKDDKGVHLVVDDDSKCNHMCFCFNCNGQLASCENFRRMPTGVKICCRNNQ